MAADEHAGASDDLQNVFLGFAQAIIAHPDAGLAGGLPRILGFGWHDPQAGPQTAVDRDALNHNLLLVANQLGETERCVELHAAAGLLSSSSPLAATQLLKPVVDALEEY